MRLRHSLVGAIAGGDRPSVLFRYSGGSGLGPQGYTFTRADASTCATYVDRNGVVQTVAANVLRDNHYVSGVRTTLLEGSRTNICVRSDALNNASWVKFGTPTVTDNSFTAGALNLSRYQGTPGTDGADQTVAFTGDGTKGWLVFAKQSNAATGTFQWIVRDSTASATRASLTLTVAAGGAISGVVAGGSSALLNTIALGSGVYCFVVQVTGIVAANTNFVRYGNSGTCADILTGGCQLENAAFPSSYIATGAAAVTRAADSLSFPFQYAPQAMTVYAKGMGLSAIDASTNYHWFTIGNDSVNTYFQGRLDGGTQTWVDIHNNGSATKTSNPATVVAYGDSLETRSVLNGDGSALAGDSLNGAAEVLGSTSATNTLASAWSQQTLYVGKTAGGTQPGFVALVSLKIASGVQSLATMRATQGDLLNYTPGDAAAPGGGTFSRADASVCATYVDANGVVQTVGPNILRNNHYVSGVRTTLLEGSRTNSLLRSGDISNAAWTKTRSSAGAATTAPDGTATAFKLVEDSSNNSHQLIQATSNNGTDNTTQAWSGFTKPGERTWAAIEILDKSGAAGSRYINLATGALGSAGGAGAALTVTSVAVGSWFLWRVTASAGAGAGTLTLRLYLATGDGGASYQGDGSSGAYFWGWQHEKDAAFPSSYIATAASAVTRAADALSFPFSPVPQAMTVYFKAIDVGESAVGAATRTGEMVTIGNAVAESFYFSTPNGKYSVNQISAAGSGASTQTAAVNNGYDTVEVLGSLSAAGVPQLTYSFNGAAEVSPAAGTARALDATFSATTLWAGGRTAAATPFLAFQKIVVASGVQSLATMRGL